MILHEYVKYQLKISSPKVDGQMKNGNRYTKITTVKKSRIPIMKIIEVTVSTFPCPQNSNLGYYNVINNINSVEINTFLEDPRIHLEQKINSVDTSRTVVSRTYKYLSGSRYKYFYAVISQEIVQG